jgi:hypothetical protein
VSGSAHPEFVDACCAAFRRLVDIYGFAGPEVEPIGRETYVRYRKGGHEVSIAFEQGAAPIVELFYPSSETGERPLPWAERNRVQRSRRIPTLRIAECFRDSDPVGFARYLTAGADALERVERAFLETPAAQ